MDEWSDDDGNAVPLDVEVPQLNTEWMRLYPGTGKLCLTPRLAMKLKIAADQLDEVIAKSLDAGELPPVKTTQQKTAMRAVLRLAREWDADGQFERYAYDDVELLPKMAADRDFDTAEKVCLYLRRIRELEEKKKLAAVA